MKRIVYILAFVFILNACKKKEDNSDQGPALKNDIPEFFAAAPDADYAKKPPVIQLIAGSNESIEDPQDLDFHPVRPDELWIINKGTPDVGGTTVMLSNAGKSNQTFDYRRDGNSWHFLSEPSALSFSNNGNWASSANTVDANQSGGTYAGPTLWSSNLNIYARPSGGNGSHLDMLHGSPYSMGIESEKDNIFWVYDAYHQYIVRYDFVIDHGPGNDNHDDGLVHRYKGVKVTRNQSGLPSHMVLDKDKRWLYIVDGGNKRVIRMDTKSGSKLQDLPLINEMLAEHWEIGGVTWEIVVPAAFGLKNPCGIDLRDHRLFVSDYTTGEIFCFDTRTNVLLNKIETGDPGIIGIKIDRHNRLWFVNAIQSEVSRVIPQ